MPCAVWILSAGQPGRLSNQRVSTNSTSPPFSRPRKAIAEEVSETVAEETWLIQRRQRDVIWLEGLWKYISGLGLRVISAGTAKASTPVACLDHRPQICEGCRVWQDHGIFFRMFPDSPNSPYDVSIGIRCSGWRKYSSRFPEVTREQVLDHMDNVSGPSPLISMTDSPARLVNFGRDSWCLTRVAVIKAKRLERIGIEHAQTTQLAQKFDLGTKSNANPHGASYLYSAHWLAQYWIPAVCMDKVMEWGEFMEVGCGEGILAIINSL